MIVGHVSRRTYPLRSVFIRRGGSIICVANVEVTVYLKSADTEPTLQSTTNSQPTSINSASAKPSEMELQ